MQRRAKIVCTLGPATSCAEMIEQLVRAGMDVARLNFSHGTHADHAQSIAHVRRASGSHQKPIAILADLQGPKIRTGALASGRARCGCVLARRLAITTQKYSGDLRSDQHHVSRAAASRCGRATAILLSDGEIALRVLSTRGDEVVCQVENGGELGEHKGINLPGIRLKIPSLTAKDREDLAVRAGAWRRLRRAEFRANGRETCARRKRPSRARERTRR